jgi:hypothetical protein
MCDALLAKCRAKPDRSAEIQQRTGADVCGVVAARVKAAKGEGLGLEQDKACSKVVPYFELDRLPTEQEMKDAKQQVRTMLVRQFQAETEAQSGLDLAKDPDDTDEEGALPEEE